MRSRAGAFLAVESLESRVLMSAAPNLALGRPTTSSSVELAQYAPTNATDASLTTRWSSAFSNNQWIQVDLGQTYNMSEVKLTWETAYGKAYKLQTSANGSTWTDAFSTTTSDGGVDDVAGLSASGRYVRMLGITRATQWGFSLFDFQVFGTAPVQPPPPPPPPPPSTTGLLANYFNGTTFSGTAVSRVDPGVNFNWGNGSPGAGIGIDNFSARWTGQLTPSVSQTYTFYTDSDDGIRLWVNHQLLVDNWKPHGLTENTATIALTAGHAVDVQLEYFELGGGAVSKLLWSAPTISKQAVPASVLTPAPQNLLSELDHAVAFAGTQVSATITSLLGKSNPYTSYPQFTTTAANGTMSWANVNGAHWAAGFWPGQMWQLYLLTGNSYWKTQAEAWTTGLSLSVTSGATGDLWSMFDNYLSRYQADGNAADLQMILSGANLKLSSWNSTVQAFHTVGRVSNSDNPKANFGVLMDQTMDLPMVLYAAQQTGNTTAVNEVITHMLTLGKTLVRADGSTAQWGYFDSATGQYVGPEAYQGYSSTSAWSRGQSWAVNAFTEVARMTGRSDMLALAQKVADYWVAHLPADGVPYWDFNAPTPTYKDSSAGAIAASGLIDLAQQLKSIDPVASAKYMASAQKTLTALAGPGYLAEGSKNPGIILHGSTFVPLNPPNADTGLSTSDYYFLQAVSRYRAAAGL